MPLSVHGVFAKRLMFWLDQNKTPTDPTGEIASELGLEGNWILEHQGKRNEKFLKLLINVYANRNFSISWKKIVQKWPDRIARREEKSKSRHYNWISELLGLLIRLPWLPYPVALCPSPQPPLELQMTSSLFPSVELISQFASHQVLSDPRSLCPDLSRPPSFHGTKRQQTVV